MQDIILIDELATALGSSPRSLKRNWLSMHERHGFPRKLPGLWGWSRLAVEAWVRSGGQAPYMPDNENVPTDPATEALAARYGGNP